MMRLIRIILICAAMLFLRSELRAATAGGTGLGIILGEPTGISMKRWTGSYQAVDLALAWSFSENSSLHIHADYLIHNFDITGDDSGGRKLPVYFGLGGRIKLSEEEGGRGRNKEDSLIGIRVPLGVSYLFDNGPVDIFLEIVPVMDLVPDTEFDLNGAAGARFYF